MPPTDEPSSQRHSDDRRGEASEKEARRVERVVLTPKEAAELLGVSEKTVYRKVNEGAIPSIRMGRGRIFIPRRPFLAMFGAADLGDDGVSGP